MAGEDPWDGDRERAREAIDKAERNIFQRVWDFLREWSARLTSAVFGRGRRVTPSGVYETEPWFRAAADDVLVVIEGEWDEAHDDVTDTDPEDYARREFTEGARNRLVRVPDSVYSLITREVFAADRDGLDTDELAEKIDAILATSGAQRWQNRARTIARTEATAAYNAGTLEGFKSLARSLGGSWEKAWLDCDDDRVRPTHRAADGQRVPLLGHFNVGGFPALHPGDFDLPARESVNCRCGMLLLRPGEAINYANRNFRER